MNDRGGIELILALVALDQGLITPNLFSVIVSVSFITTFISIILFRMQVHKNLAKLGPMIDGAINCPIKRSGGLGRA